MSSQNHEEAYQRVLDRITRRESEITVVGLGYVGLPLASALIAAGFRVLGYDLDPQKVVQLNNGTSYIKTVPTERISEMRKTNRFRATSNIAESSSSDAILICVPTPLSKNREPDISYVVSTSESLAPYLRPYQMVVLESTTYPGTTSEVMRPILESNGLVSGETLYLAYSPEREDPGNPTFSTSTIPKVVGGEGDRALNLAEALYGQVTTGVVKVRSTSVAEAVKLTENIFRSVNIALVNELKIVFERMGIDVWEVIDAAKTKPFGFMPFYPGPGLGGHCIPIDPFYLTWKAREYGVSTRFVELAGEVNSSMPDYVLQRTAEALDRKFGKGLNGSSVLVVGVAYKKNVDDPRESPAFVLIDLLEARGAKVSYYDPYIPSLPVMREHPHLEGKKSVGWEAGSLSNFNVAIICTDHDGVDYANLLGSCPLIIDTRNALKGYPSIDSCEVVKA